MTVTPRTDVAVDRQSCFVVISSARRNEAVTIAVHGDLDRASQVEVHTALMAIVSSFQPSHVTLDLAQLAFCDCAGARMLAEVHQTLAARGTTYLECHPQPHVAWLLEWMRQHRP